MFKHDQYQDKVATDITMQSQNDYYPSNNRNSFHGNYLNC